MKNLSQMFGLVILAASLCQGQAPTDNAKLTELFNVDQAARKGKDIDWSKLTVEDAKRREDVHRMLDAGEVRTATDYFHASLVYQHGMNPDDYLLAHVLAETSVSLGGKEARWLAAATLDRYLRALHQPQVYGTQFASDAKKVWTQQEMNPNLVSDSMRKASCVISKEEQAQVLKKVNEGAQFSGTYDQSCDSM